MSLFSWYPLCQGLEKKWQHCPIKESQSVSTSWAIVLKRWEARADKNFLNTEPVSFSGWQSPMLSSVLCNIGNFSNKWQSL